MHPTFELVREETIASLDVTLFEYIHVKTKARHLHIKAKDNNNAFLVAFLTVPQDSTGVAHILEHTALCGSKRYPVRDPFFMMIRRSLNTFMNAFTAPDWTAYPFASKNTKDFYNLLDVYLDAAFFPNLDYMDFLQEGHRLEFEIADDSNSPLVYKGVVFNEMKGAMSSPTSVLYQELTKNLFPTITYHHNSGGDPACIPDLTHAQLKAFHAKHYHPSNSIFMTYGDLPAEDHQKVFESRVLSQFDYESFDFNVRDEIRFVHPKNVESFYAQPKEEPLDHKSHVVLAWLLGAVTDPKALMRARILAGALLDNSASPLRLALETSDLGAAPSPFCGIEDSTRESFFSCGLEGVDENNADAVEQLIFQTLKDVKENGIPQDHLEAVLHQLELSSREISGSHYPYGLKLMLDCLNPALHGGDPLHGLDLDPMLDEMRLEIANPHFISDLVDQLLLTNQHRVRLVLKPSHTLADSLVTAEAERLAAIKANLTTDQIKQIIEETQKLKIRQDQIDNPDILPEVTRADIPETLSIPTGTETQLNYTKLSQFTPTTNGMVYQSLVVNLPKLTAEELLLLPYLDSLLSEVGCGSDDYLTMQAKIAANTGGINSRMMLRTQLGNAQNIDGLWILSGKALARNSFQLTDLLGNIFQNARFDEGKHLQEIISQIRLGREDAIVGSGHGYAMGVASQYISPLSYISQQMDGMRSIQSLRGLDTKMENCAYQAEFGAKLHALLIKLQSSSYELLSLADARDIKDASAHLIQRFDLPNAQQHVELFNAPFAWTPKVTKEAWAINAAVHYCAKSYATVAAEHPDAPALNVLAGFLRNGFLHKAIREQGGAYGGGASYSSSTGAFNFFSYRDPRLSETLHDFDSAIDWLVTHHHEERALEEAILGVISAIDKPSSPAGECADNYYNSRFGRTPSYRQAYRANILKVTIADLQRVGHAYFDTRKAHIAVLGPKASIEQLDLEINTL